MTAYALLRIKPGASCYQDFAFYEWPISQYGDQGKRMADIPDDAVFVGQKISKPGGVYWDCKTHGAGMPGSYGNGSIFVRGRDSVELLTPMLGYEPTHPTDSGQAGAGGEQ